MVTRLAMAVLSSTLAGSAAAQVSFEPMGIPPAYSGSQGSGISDDGNVVVGTLSIGRQAAIWTRSGGLTQLGIVGSAWDATADGSTIVGYEFAEGAFQWTRAGGKTPIPELGSASAISADGSAILGSVWQRERVTPAILRDGMLSTVDLPDHGHVVPGGMSADGRTAAGWVFVGAIPHAWRWTEGGSTETIAPPSGYSLDIRGLSPDGRTILGSVRKDGMSYAAIWDESGELKRIDAGLTFAGSSDAMAASFGGSVIVGGATGASRDDAFVWTRDTGARRLSDILDRHGVLPEGWQLRAANAISADGLTITGYGFNPAGDREGWIVTIPAPGTAAVAGVALMLGVQRRRPSPTCRAASATPESS